MFKKITLIMFALALSTQPMLAMSEKALAKWKKAEQEKREVAAAAAARTTPIASSSSVIPAAPPAPALKPSSPAVKQKVKVAVQPKPTQYTGYRKLAILLTSDEEKLSNEALKTLSDHEDIDDPSFQSAFTNLLADILCQKAIPVLVCEPCILENIFLLQYATAKFSEKNDYDSADLKQTLRDDAEMRKDAQNMKKSNPGPISEKSPFFIRYKELYSPRDKDESEDGAEYISSIPIDFPLDVIPNGWALFEYHDTHPSEKAYLLIPSPQKSDPMQLLIAHGFNPAVFRYKPFAVFMKELKEKSDYSDYGKKGSKKEVMSSQEVKAALHAFSLSALTIINQSLTDDATKPWTLLIGGHGQIKTSELSDASIAGMSADVLTKGLLPLLVDKNSRFCYFWTCDIGGGNRDLIREVFANVHIANELLPELKSMLKKKTPQYPNNLITVVGGISDITVLSMTPVPIPTDSIASFNKVWTSIDKDDPIAMHFLPLIPSVRYDLFFKGLEQHLRAEDQKGKSTKELVTPWKELLKYVTPYNFAKGEYFYSNIPQIRFPTHDAAFNALEVDGRIQVLTYVDVKAREFEAKLRGQAAAKPIIVDNKDMLIVYPLSVNAPVEMMQKDPAIVPARAETMGMFFKKITCPPSKNLQNTIHTLFTYEAMGGRKIARSFLVEELGLSNRVYKDVLVTSKSVEPEGVWNEETKEYDYPASAWVWNEQTQEEGSESSEPEFAGASVDISVYYRTPDNKLMKYHYEHKEHEKEIKVPEDDITNSYEAAAIEAMINGVKESISKEEAL